MLTVRGLTKSFAAKDGETGTALAVEDSTFTVEAGSFFTLLGPSGCGKTTTLRCIAGLEDPDAGTIRLGEQHAVLIRRRRRRAIPTNGASGWCSSRTRSGRTWTCSRTWPSR